jgi:hypothetical protein
LAGPAATAKLAATRQQKVLAADVTARTIGLLRCLVVGPDNHAADHDTESLLIGQVVWLATDSGWVGLRPIPDGSGQQLVELVPVANDEIGRWLAPYVAQILEATDDRP